MEDNLKRRVGAAAVAGWWTILILAVWLTVGWLIWLLILHFQPSWLLKLWGGGPITYETVQTVVLWVFGGMKALLWAALGVVIWLTLWARRL